MSKATPVSNFAADYEETVLRLARHLGRDKTRRAVFSLIYGRGSKYQSKKQIAARLSKEEAPQVVQNALDHLQKHHLIVRVENEGRVKDGSRWLYGKEDSIRAHRSVIVRYADNPEAAKKVSTKRRPTVDINVSLVRPVVGRRAARDTLSHVKQSKARLRLAVLVTNPTAAGPLQTGYEARYIEAGIALANRTNDVELKLVLAPTLSVMLDVLNRYRPDIIHFSGHGGGRSLLFDNEQAGNTTDTVLDFDMVARVIESTSAAPKLIVLAACDTVDGADRFLLQVPAVVAMASNINDTAACEFSGQFYRSLCSGATIGQALSQAKLVLESKGYQDASLPALVARDASVASLVLL